MPAVHCPPLDVHSVASDCSVALQVAVSLESNELVTVDEPPEEELSEEQLLLPIVVTAKSSIRAENPKMRTEGEGLKIFMFA